MRRSMAALPILALAAEPGRAGDRRRLPRPRAGERRAGADRPGGAADRDQRLCGGRWPLFRSWRSLPSLAVLAIAVAFLGLGLANVELALIVLAVPPIVTNAYAAVDGRSSDLGARCRAWPCWRSPSPSSASGWRTSSWR